MRGAHGEEAGGTGRQGQSDWVSAVEHPCPPIAAQIRMRHRTSVIVKQIDLLTSNRPLGVNITILGAWVRSTQPETPFHFQPN